MDRDILYMYWVCITFFVFTAVILLSHTECGDFFYDLFMECKK